MKRTLLLCFLVVMSFTMQAQLLWEITGKELSKPSYLFGTHHAIPLTLLDSIPHLYRSYNRCDVVIGELMIDEEKSVNRMVNAATMVQTIDQYLTPEDYLLVDSAMRALYGFSLKMVANLRPSMISNMIVMAQLEKLYPDMKENGQMDSFFQTVATEQGKTVVGLETIDDQIDLLFRSQSLERQAFLLVGQVKEGDIGVEEMHELSRLYRAGDLEAMLEIYEGDTGLYAPTTGERFLMLENRNRDWAEKLPALMKKSPSFITVGAMHLPGKNGIIELLRKKGYKVKAVL